MSQTTNLPPPPLHLCEVLEEEFVVLHGQLPAGYPADADAETRLSAIYTLIHALPDKRAAVCFSGGGIRSATYGLGILQGLARHGLLDKFHYVSTVSGGGYLGSWLSAWIHRKGIRNVQDALRSRPKTKLQPEPEPVRHLRSYSRYMSPKFGLLSADTWTLVAIFLRNLFLNWLVLVPLILGALMLPRLYAAVVGWNAPTDVVQAVFWGGVVLGIFSIAYMVANRPSLSSPLKPVSRFPPGRKNEGWFLLLGMLPLAALALMSATYWAWLRSAGELSFVVFGRTLPSWLAFTLFGTLLHLGGYLVSRLWVRQIRPYEPVVIILSGAIGGLLTWVAAAYVFPHPLIASAALPVAVRATLFACFAVPLFLLLFLLAATMFVGLGSYHTDDADREWLARAGAWILITILLWSVVSVLVIYAPVGLLYLGPKMKIFLTTLGGVSGFVTLKGGSSQQTPAADNKQSSSSGAGGKDKKKSGIAGIVKSLAPVLAAPIFAVFILVVLSLATSLLIKSLSTALATSSNAFVVWLSQLFSLRGDWNSLPPLPLDGNGQPYDPYGLLNVVYYAPGWFVFALMLVIVAFGILMGFFVNINKFSLHAAYRDRLIRAYLGASRNRTERRPNPFTGLDEDDNIQMQELRTELFYAESFARLGDLIQRLRDRQDSVSAFIWDGLSEETRDLLNVYEPQTPPPDDEDIRHALADDLNRIVQRESIYTPERFQGVPLTGEIESLLTQKPLVEVLRLNRLLLDAAYPGDFAFSQMRRPLHVVNVTLNLVGGKELAYQDRKAESFTVSPLHSGSFCVGYRRSKEYAVNSKTASAISLGTAAAISGAAASPNMGYYSSPAVTFLMSLFNVRLGWWLGNPGRAGRDTYMTPGPKFAPRALIAETLGWTSDKHPYVYLSDGGHFENLGLYEMILRRCHVVVVSDASADPTFSFNDLGSAIGKIRRDLGVPIVFDEIPIHSTAGELPTYSKNTNAVNKYCAVARICYSCIDGAGADGVLLYIKPTVYGSEPADVYHYAKSNATFPHESTGDQLYSESQFESYRALASHAFEEICAGKPINTLDDLIQQACAYLGQTRLPNCPP